MLSDNNTAEPRGAEGDLIGDRDQKETFAARPPEVCGQKPNGANGPTHKKTCLLERASRRTVEQDNIV